jgi:hypothetical protein
VYQVSKRLIKKIDTLDNNFFEKMKNFTSKNLISFLTFFSIDLVAMEGLF